MTDPMMDFFDDPNLFVGGLEGLSDEGFTSGPVSLVDELNLSAGFEPLQVEPLGIGKHPGIVPTTSSQSLTFEQQISHFEAMKTPHPIGQAFPASEGGASGAVMSQHAQFHSSPAQQAPQSNGLFPDSSPMWGNQDQNGNSFHQLPPQQPAHHPHLNQPHHHHLQQPQQHVAAQPLHQHSKAFPEHHDFDFYQGNLAPKQQQPQQNPHGLPHSLPLNADGSRNGSPFHHGGAANAMNQPAKAYLDAHGTSFSGGAPQQQQQSRMLSCQGAQKFPGPAEDMSLPFSCSPALSSCSVSSSVAYPPPQYSFPGQPPAPAPAVSAKPAGASALHASMPDFSGAGDAFSLLPGMGQQQEQQEPVSQAGKCPFQALHQPRQAQRSYNSSGMFSQDMGCYSGAMSQHPSNQQGSCQAAIPAVTAGNGYQALDENLLQQVGGHSGGFGELEAPDLLGDDLLPQLEAALSQETPLEHQDDSNCSWTNGNQEEDEDSSFSVNYELKVRLGVCLTNLCCPVKGICA